MSDKHSLQERVIGIVADTLKIEQSEVTPSSTFESLGADSLDMLEIIMNIEKEFGIDIDDEKAADITTVQQAIHEIQKAL